MAEDGAAPERVAVLTRSAPAAARLRERVEALLEGPFEELWIQPYPALAERLLREHAVEAGLDPFFGTVGAADRLAMLLDRVDELPLRHHQIRGNPAGPAGAAAGANRRAEGGGGRRRRRSATWASGRERDAAGEGDREAARRELEFAELYARHDSILAEAGNLDAGRSACSGWHVSSARAPTSESGSAHASSR